MLLKISTKTQKADEISYLLHKHPDRLQSVEIPAGSAHIFYPLATEFQCTVCLALDINPITLARNNRDNRADFSLAEYVNDRPYVASSYLSVAIAKAFGTAMNGTCKQRPELVDKAFSFDVTISVLAAPRGGEGLIHRLFEPLGYKISVQKHPLDLKFPEWGDSRYFTVILSGKQKLKYLLSHLYVLLPALDSSKHYWVSEEEVNKLLSKGEAWLANHPEKGVISSRYLKNIRKLSRNALDRLSEAAGDTPEDELNAETSQEKFVSLHEKRLIAAFEELKTSGITSVADLGCGEGKLIKKLLKEKQFTNILGMDVASGELQKAVDRLHYHDMPQRQKERLTLIHGSLTYRDKRLEGYDAITLIEVIEHLELTRLDALEKVVFKYARPGMIIVTTPNREYNDLFEGMSDGQYRHTDHRFEWDRIEFASWTEKICDAYDYKCFIKPVGEEDDKVGAPSQMAIFNTKS